MAQGFLNDETGGANVEWVLITAVMVGLGLSVMGVMTTGLDTIADALAVQMADR